MARIVEMIVSPKGEVTITTKGYAGAGCVQASKGLEQALGVPSSDQKTAEFYQVEAVQQQVQQ